MKLAPPRRLAGSASGPSPHRLTTPSDFDAGAAKSDRLLGTTIWDWPLRIWHWAFAAFIALSLYSSLAGDIGLLEWHQRSGLVLLG